MKKNTKIHFWVESEYKSILEKQANSEGLTISQYCRNKLIENSQIIKIEDIVEKILYILENRKIYKEVPLKNSK